MEQKKPNLKIVADKKKRKNDFTKYVNPDGCMYWFNFN